MICVIFLINSPTNKNLCCVSFSYHEELLAFPDHEGQAFVGRHVLDQLLLIGLASRLAPLPRARCVPEAVSIVELEQRGRKAHR